MEHIQSESMFKRTLFKYFEGNPSLAKVVVKEASKKKKPTGAPNEPVAASNVAAAAPQSALPKFGSLDEAIKYRQDIKNLAESYKASDVEQHWYQWWEREKFFHADEKAAQNVPEDQKYVIVIPPPNVTGYLHIGHALTGSIEDALIRYNRMKGKITCYVPGVDHAGIATQTVVEKQLAKQGQMRKDMTREAFLKKVWEWKEHSGSRIDSQLRRLGSSLDWDRYTFTMDEQRSVAVTEAFIRLFEQGLIYRSSRLVNWSCKLQTAISEIEVETIELPEPTKISVPNHSKAVEFGYLTKFAYKVKDSPNGEEIVVATTRLETMLGDVAVAVNSTDERYQHLIGKELIHPFHPSRKMVVIADDILVKKEFGTGAVKVTPSHDQNDYECGQRNQLPMINIFDEEGRLNENGGEAYKGMLRYECREKMEKDLEAMGLLRGKDVNKGMALKICSRSKDIIEPMMKPQWYVKCDTIAKRMLEVVDNGELQIIPEQPHIKIWRNYMNDLRDWCISRQLWWGHRCPAYLVSIKGAEKKGDPNSTSDWVVAQNEKEALEKAVKKFGVPADQIELLHDEDVLDTWFSSALFPFSPFNWPNEEDLSYKAFYPNAILETGYDILFFWVARMVMFGLMLTNKLPFKKVYLHTLVRDEEGRKMSKSLGNVIDPLELIEGCDLENILQKIKESTLPEKEKQKSMEMKKKNYPQGYPECGTDALRFGLLSYTTQSSDILLDVKKIIALRQFCNKIWNSFKFASMKFTADFVYDPNFVLQNYSALHRIHKWILSRLHSAIRDFDAAIEKYRFGDSTSAFQQFWLYDFCDVYLEATKPMFLSNDEAAKKAAEQILYTILDSGLRMISPVMPFITEELYQKLPSYEGKPRSVCIARFPEWNVQYIDTKLEEENDLMMNVIKEIRSITMAVQLPSSVKPNAYLSLVGGADPNSELIKKLLENSSTIEFLAKLTKVNETTLMMGIELILDGNRSRETLCLMDAFRVQLVLRL